MMMFKMSCVAVLVALAQAPGPTMDDTKTWLEFEGRDLLHARRIQTIQLAVSVHDEVVTTITLDSCRLAWHLARSGYVKNVRTGTTTPARNEVDDISVSLAGISSVSVEPETLATDQPIYVVRLVAKDPALGDITRSTNGNNPELMRAGRLAVSTQDDGQRVANAIKHAMTLCGVTSSGVF